MKKLLISITLAIGLTPLKANSGEAVYDTSGICIEQVERIKACESTLTYCGDAHRAVTSVYDTCQSISSEREDQLSEVYLYLDNAEAALANPLRNPWIMIPLGLLVGGFAGALVVK